MDIARVPCHEDDGDTEEQGKYEADSGIGGDKPALVEEFDQPHCKDTHEGRADNEEGRIQAADGKESEYDAEEDGMADGVSQHGHAPEDEEVPGRAQAADMKMAIRSISAKEFISGLLP